MYLPLPLPKEDLPEPSVLLSSLLTVVEVPGLLDDLYRKALSASHKLVYLRRF